MKVLLTTDTLGGVWSYAVELAGALEALGHDIDLATMGRPLTVGQRIEVSRLARTTVHESGFALEWMEEPWDDVRRAGDWLLDLERRTAPDVVHLNQYAFGALPWRLAPLVVAHSCVCSWWEAVRCEAAPADWDHYRSAVRAGLDGAAVLAAPSAAMLRAVERHHGGARPAARVIPNGRDPVRFAPRPKAPFVLTIGRLWDEAKNVAAVGRAAAMIPWPTYVAGEIAGPGGRRAELGTAHGLGPLSQSDVAGWLGRAAIYALPARYEPFGLATLEAALAGAALVLGDIPSLRETWDDAALFVAPDDVAALADAIRGLIGDGQLRDALGRRARGRALTFTPERMARGYLAAYDAVLSGAQRPGGALACAS